MNDIEENRAFEAVNIRRSISERRFNQYLLNQHSHAPVKLCGETIDSFRMKSSADSTIFVSIHTTAYFLLFSLVASCGKPVYVVVNRSIINKFESVDPKYRRNMRFTETITPSIMKDLNNKSAHLFIMADVLVNHSLRSHIPFMERWLTYSINWSRIVLLTDAKLCVMTLLDKEDETVAMCDFVTDHKGDIYNCVHKVFSLLENQLGGRLDLWENYPVWERLATQIVDTKSGWNRQLLSEFYRLSCWNADLIDALNVISESHSNVKMN